MLPITNPITASAAARQPLFTIAIPGQSFAVQTNLVNEGADSVTVNGVEVSATDGKAWSIKPEKSPDPLLASGKEAKLKFTVSAPPDATLTKAYFDRPNLEQPYYDVKDERYRNLSYAPYPLIASLHLAYHDASFDISKVVQANQRIEGIGMVQNPVIMGPAISISVSPSAGAVPLSSSAFNFSCAIHSNVKGAAKGTVRLRLPEGWQSSPAEAPFSFARDGDNQTVTFEVTAHDIKPRRYEIRAEALYDGKTFEEGYRLVGYPGVRPYPFYRSSKYEAVGVDVTTAPNLHVGFLAGTGDDVPRALEDLGLHPQILSAADIETGDLSRFDAIVLGVRAYAVRTELRSANSRLLNYVKDGGVLIVQYNLQNFDREPGPYSFSLGPNPAKVVDEGSAVTLLLPDNPAFTWPNKITASDFAGWEEERGHGFMQKWDAKYEPLVETHDPDQDPQKGGLLLAHYGKGIYVYDAFALYRQLPAGVPGAYRILANLVSLGKNPGWR